MQHLMNFNKDEGFLRIKVFDVNSRKNNPTKIATGNPADSYLISYYNEGNIVHILLDAGKPEHGEKIIIPYLVENGIDKLDYLILSHMHVDHFGGMTDILKGNRISVEQFIYSPIPDRKIQQANGDEFYQMWVEFKQCIKRRR